MIQDGSVPILQPITFLKKLSASDAHLTVDLPGNVDRAGPAAIVPDGRYVSALPQRCNESREETAKDRRTEFKTVQWNAIG